MKKALMIRLVLFLALLLASCSQAAGSSSGKTIQPGDKIGDFIITTGVPGNFSYGFSIQCSQPAQGDAYTCDVPVGEVINVSTGLVDTTGKGNLDQVWAHSNYQMFINDQAVNLQAFGTVDYTHAQMGKIRFANVVISTDKPGEITVRDTGLFDNGDPFSSTSIYVYSKP